MTLEYLTASDPVVASLIRAELDRERTQIELIASENFTSLSVMEAVGSLLTNKYSEGYPGKRYYGGCYVVDEVEELARERAKQLFSADFANVQPHSGVSANLAAFMALLEPGDTILGMSLAHGGHLSHGSPANYSGRNYQVFSYAVDPQSERIDLDEVERIALECRPKMIIVGASAYPRIIDFEQFGAIAKKVGAYLMADIAHTAGLVATGFHPSPVPWADVVTSTSHKTLRGPRGGFILTNNEEVANAIDKAVFPGSQGGPLQHVIAGKAVAFGEAMLPSFRVYTEQILANMQAMCEGLLEGGLRLVTGGTDNHLALVDLTAAEISGAEAEVLLEKTGITVNKNVIPNEQRPAIEASGIRVGTAAMTTRGFDADEAKEIGLLIAQAIFGRLDLNDLARIKERVSEMLARHPLYPELG
ncbi:MAG: serine hydroxymethyltransferase [Coriobacteriia bacterium]|nr:serine hydroxymethyltransferase [Coriobacteriia bacterium]